MEIKGAVRLDQKATPGTNPPSGKTLLYVKSDNKVYTLDSGGNEVLVGPATPAQIGATPGAQLSSGALAATAGPSSYPTGVSLFDVSDSAWPETYGVVVTNNVNINRSQQFFMAKSGKVYTRSGDTAQTNGWTGWTNFEPAIATGTASPPQYWRGDKTWQPLFDGTKPAALGTAATGTTATVAHRDHVHQMPSLAALTDTAVATAQDGDLLVYNAASAQWQRLALDTWHNVGTSGQPAFQNGWVNTGGSDAVVSYYKDRSGFVHVVGVCTSGSLGFVPVFSLPSGYRPPGDMNMSVMGGGNLVRAKVYASTGNIGIAGTGTASTWYDLSGLSPWQGT